jgi:hypothetical protein
VKITPLTHPLDATVRVPGSKSLTNRALLVASLAQGTTRLQNALFSDDSRYFAQALKTLGFDIQLEEARHEMTVTGLGGTIPASNAELSHCAPDVGTGGISVGGRFSNARTPNSRSDQRSESTRSRVGIYQPLSACPNICKRFTGWKNKNSRKYFVSIPFGIIDGRSLC